MNQDEPRDPGTEVVDPPPASPPAPSQTTQAIQAMRDALAKGEAKNELADPAIAEAGTAVVTKKPVAAETLAEKVEEKVAEQAEEKVEEKVEEKLDAKTDESTTEVVTLPARREGDVPVEITLEDKEAADALRAAIRGGIRREQLHRAMQDVDGRLEEVRSVEDEIEVDPVNFVFGRLAEEKHTALARELLAQPGIFEALKEELQTWMNDDKDRETARLKSKDERSTRLRSSQDEVAARIGARAAARGVRNAVNRMIPEEMDEEGAADARNDMLRDLRDYQLAHDDKLLRVDDLVPILERRLRQYGIEPDAARAAVTAHEPPPVRSASPRKPAPAAAPAPGARKPDEAAARTAGQKLVAAAAARKAGAQVPGAGAGSPAAGPELPPGQGVKDRVKTMRTRLGLRPK